MTKKIRAFRLSDHHYEELQTQAKANNTTATGMIEKLIDQGSPQSAYPSDIQGYGETQSPPSSTIRKDDLKAGWRVWEAMFKMSEFGDKYFQQPLKDEGIVIFGSTSFGFYGRELDPDRCKEIVETIITDQEPLKFLWDFDINKGFYVDGELETFDFYEIEPGDELRFHQIAVGCIDRDIVSALKLGVTYTEEETPYFSHEYKGTKYYYQIMTQDETVAYIQDKERRDYIARLESLCKTVHKSPSNSKEAFMFAFLSMSMKDYLGSEPKNLNDLKRIYKKRAKELHPDTNKSEFAELEFQALQAVRAWWEAELLEKQIVDQMKKRLAGV